MTGNEFGGGGSGKPCNRGSDGVTIAQNATDLSGDYMQDTSAKQVQQRNHYFLNVRLEH